MVTAEDRMVARDLKGVLFDSFGRNVGKHAFKPEAVKLFCEDRLTVKDNKVYIK